VVNNTLSSNFVRPDEANKAQSMVKDKGKHTLINKVQVRYVSDDDKHWAELKNFGHKHVHIPEHFLRDYDRLLMGGIWVQLDIRHQFDEEQKGKRSPFWIDSLKPIQLATLTCFGVPRSRIRPLTTTPSDGTTAAAILSAFPFGTTPVTPSTACSRAANPSSTPPSEFSTARFITTIRR
jgi:Putative ATP-dependent Lon protease